VVDIVDTTSSLPTLRVSAATTGYASDVVRISSNNTGTPTAYNALKVTNSSSANHLIVRGDGTVMVGTASVTNTSLVNIAGRVHVSANATFDLTGNTTAETLAATGSVTVADGQLAYLLAARPTFTLSGTGIGAAERLDVTLASAAAGTAAYGTRLTLAAAGTAGQAYGYRAHLTTSGGHSGNLVGMSLQLDGQATTVSSAGLAINFGGVNHTASGVAISGTAGHNLTYGYLIDSTIKVTTAAFANFQQAAATGDFLRYVDSGAANRFVVDANGDMTMGGTARRIKADLSNATHSNRLAFQSATTNGASYVCTLPNGTATEAGWGAYNDSDLSGAYNRLLFRATASETELWSESVNGAAELPLRLKVGALVPLIAHINGDAQVGNGLSGTTDNDGFVYIPSCAGPPTGTPTVRSGFIAFAYDTTNNRIYAYNGSWRMVAVA
jgi:hypothetical protein